MPVEQYGTTQVRELHFTKGEVHRLVAENAYGRLEKPYDFDYDHPIILVDDSGGIIVRYVQQTVTREARSKLINLSPIKVKP